MKTKVVIIGGGPAGLSASLYLSRAGIRHIVLEKGEFGGNILEAINVRNYPGIKEISGRKFIENLRAQLNEFNIDFIRTTVKEIKKKDRSFIISTKRQGDIESEKIIIATGSRPVEGDIFIHNYVNTSFCALCDGNNFKGKDISVIGAGNNGVDSAIYLSNIVNSVKVFTDKDKSDADIYSYEKAKSIKNIEFYFNYRARDIYEDRIEFDTDMGKEIVKTHGVFIYTGFKPNTEIFKGFIDMEDGYILVDNNEMTNVEGIYAAGDCTRHSKGQLITSISQGASAAISVGKVFRKCIN